MIEKARIFKKTNFRIKRGKPFRFILVILIHLL